MIHPGIINPETLQSIKEKIATAAQKSGRSGNDVQIIAVTKTFPIYAIKSALEHGIRCIGENRAQEVFEKISHFNKPDNTEFHFIGHLQSNKVRKMLNCMDVIETVDSIKLAKRISVISTDMKKQASVYLQVNTGNDIAKHGFSPDQALSAAEQISSFENLTLDGVMTIPPFVQDKNILNPIFEKTSQIREAIYEKINSSCKSLSMGMSSDFELAVENGATHIRLGTILFGQRN